MALSPDDITSYAFKQSLRGYAIDQVDELLDRLADQVERSDREIDELRQRLRDTEARLASALETESTLKRTLVTAQDAAERALAEARSQADELRQRAERVVTEQLENARDEASRIVAEAHAEARAELDAGRQQAVAFERRVDALRELSQRHQELLERHLTAQLDQLRALTAEQARLPRPEVVAPAAPSGDWDDTAGSESDTTLAAENGQPTPEDAQPGPEPMAPAAGTQPGEPRDHGLTVRVREADEPDQQLGSDERPWGD